MPFSKIHLKSLPQACHDLGLSTEKKTNCVTPNEIRTMKRSISKQVLNGFFYADAKAVSAHLPHGLQLLEFHPGEAVINITAFPICSVRRKS